MPCEQHPAEVLIQARKLLSCKFIKYLRVLCISFSLLHLFDTKRSGVGRSQSTPSSGTLWAQELALSVALSWKCGWGTKKKVCSVCVWADLIKSQHCFASFQLVAEVQLGARSSPPPPSTTPALSCLPPGLLDYSLVTGPLVASREARWPVAKIRTEKTYPGDDQRLVEVYASWESEAPGRRAREDHILGHDAVLRVGPTMGAHCVSRNRTIHLVPQAVT